MRYDTIVKCDLASYKTNKTRYKSCYLLTYKSCSSELEIELTGAMWFNTEYKAIKRKVVAKVDNAKELIDFICSNEINIPINDRKEIFNLDTRTINVGGCRDYVLDFDLNILGLKEEIDTYNNTKIIKEYLK